MALPPFSLRLAAVVAAVLGSSCAPSLTRAAGPNDPPPRVPALLFADEVQNEADVVRLLRAHYTKYEYSVAMRDGVRLHTAAYVPKDVSRKYGIVMQRTPYSAEPYGVDEYPKVQSPRTLRKFLTHHALLREGYIFVHQDVRGKFMSGGDYVDVRPASAQVADPLRKAIDESTDTYDSIDWLVKNLPQNNGRVGILGISYPGFYAAQAAITPHPALRAISPQAPVTEWFLGDDFHHNGAFFVAEAFDFYASFGKVRTAPQKTMTWGFDYKTGDLYDFFLQMGPVSNANTLYFKGAIPFWNDVMAHESRDAFWQARDPRKHYEQSKATVTSPSILTVGGWFDAEDLYGALATYQAFEKSSKAGGNVRINALVMGPWRHGGWSRTDGDALGPVTFGSKTSSDYKNKIEAPFLRSMLSEPRKGEALPKVPEARMFETGTNTWREFDAWPPKATEMDLWLTPGGKVQKAAFETDASKAYISDPAKPVPYLGRSSNEIDATYMIEDQRFAARRPDVLVFESEVLTRDLTLGGPIEADLKVSTTGTDADFIVKLIDVYPGDAADPEPNPKGIKMGGMQQLVRAEVMRAKFRSSMEVPTPLVPNQETSVRFTLPDVLHAFRTGHRLMVQIQSSWFPLVDRNPQKFLNIRGAKAEDFHAEEIKIHFGKTGSKLKVPVLSGALD
jgi:uncharacterized protein